MADKRDYYEILGVSKTATESEIKSAFRKKAKECHPDLHPGDKAKEAQFKELNEAAEILSDADKRAKYDQFGHAAFDPSMGGQDPFSGGGFGGFGDFGDILGQMFGGGFGGFGGGQTRNGPIPGDDLRYNLTITFEEAAFGVEKEITIPREEVCETCHGSGAKPGTEPVTCKTCNGTGQVRTQQSTILGSFTSTRPCTACKGTGKVIADPCADCRGTGRVRKNLKKTVKIPAGIDNGQSLCLRGMGSAGHRGGQNGDLYVTITVRPHRQFTRKGVDLYLDMPISFTMAALGGSLTVPTLKESVKYQIPAGTQTGSTFRLREQGVQRLNANGKGDLLVTVAIEVPKHLSDEQRRILEQFAETLGEAGEGRTGKKSGFNRASGSKK
ncbi:MAG: molecular chaperone DnaJ [Christensenella sp.]|nr:molecular chaperone DnaJ [Christensenella sp.]